MRQTLDYTLCDVYVIAALGLGAVLLKILQCLLMSMQILLKISGVKLCFHWEVHVRVLVWWWFYC